MSAERFDFPQPLPALHFEFLTGLGSPRDVRLDLIDVDRGMRIDLTPRERHIAIALCKHVIDQLSKEEA